MRLSSASTPKTFRAYWSQVKDKKDGKELAGLKYFEGASQTDEQAASFHVSAVDAPAAVPQAWQFGEPVYVSLQGSTDSAQSECRRSALKFSRFAQCADGSSGMLLYCPQLRPVAALEAYSVPPTPSDVVHVHAAHACYIVPAAMVFKAG